MRYLLLSDLHSNIEALEAVLADASARGFDRVLCMGDLVGYGANPNEVVERLRGLDPIVIRGNHDKVISGVEGGEQFNLLAMQSSLWTARALTAENRAYLAALPRGPLQIDGEFWIAHGSPLDEDAYLLGDFDAIEVFRDFPGDLCFFGHSHIPTLFALEVVQGFYLLSPVGDDERIPLEPKTRYLINCGSVGQPRDRNPKAAFGIFDADRRTLGLHRVAYALAEAQRKILETTLPRFLAERLGVGV